MQMIALMIGVPATLAVWLAMFVRWQRGIYYLVAFVPYAGIFTLMLRPNPLGVLLKDFLIVLPLYAVFFLLHTRELRRAHIPNAITLLTVVFGALVLLQIFNPALRSIVVGAVGAKVWLLYIPLAYLASAQMRTPEDLVRLMRLAMAVAVFPCALGIFEFILSSSIGYAPAMALIYGRNAEAVTQGFTLFNMGSDFFRIPSTFTYVTQYSGFTLMMVAVTYIHLSIESNWTWRIFSRVMMGVILIACLLSGARSNFVFTPMLLMTILFLDAKLTRLALGLVFGPLVMVTTLQVAGIDVLRLLGATTDLTQSYGEDLVLPGLIKSLTNNPLGAGTGMNTGGAVALMSQNQLATTTMIEGYYAKAVVELGFPGLMLLLLIIGGLILYGLQLRARLRDPMAKTCASAIVAFLIVMAVHSFKGWQVDLDPINVWYWILVGILFSLPQMQFTEIRERRRRMEAERAEHRRNGSRRTRRRPAPAFRAGDVRR